MRIQCPPVGKLDAPRVAGVAQAIDDTSAENKLLDGDELDVTDTETLHPFAKPGAAHHRITR